MKTIYVCPDSLEGIFTGIYYAWNSRHCKERDKLSVIGGDTMELFSEYVYLEAEEDKSRVVYRTVQKYTGTEAFEEIYTAAMSYEPKKADAILGTVIAAAKIPNGKKVMDYLSNESVRTVFELNRTVGNEVHHFKMFVRFKELQNGILFAEITPKNNVLPLLISHFADRFPLENWVIYDHKHREFLIHKRQEGCLIVSGEELDLDEIKKFSDREKEMDRLWKQFTESISIKERENKNLQRQNLPIKFRRHMTEFE